MIRAGQRDVQVPLGLRARCHRGPTREDVDLHIAVREELDFPSLAWHRDLNGQCLGAEVAEGVVEVRTLQALQKIEEVPRGFTSAVVSRGDVVSPNAQAHVRASQK